jgi:integrase
VRLTVAIDTYLGELARRGRTPATRQKYREVLYPFVATMPREQPVDAMTKDDCRRYLDHWADAAPATLALYVSILTRFFAFCVDEELIARSPMEKIRRPPLKRAEELDVVTVSSGEVERLFAACQELDEFLCVALLGYLGPRRSAAAVLRWGDLDFAEGTVRFHEKGAKVIVKPIPDELREMLYQVALSGLVPAAPEDYVIPNRASGPRESGLVRFVAKRGRRSNKIVYDRVKRVAARAGVNVHPHALRAAFAVHYLESHEGDLDALQKLMGHTRVETTQVYLRRQDRFRAMERVRDLSWGAVLPSSRGVPPAGFEPAFGDSIVPEPLKRKLEELRARTRAHEPKGSRRGRR